MSISARPWRGLAAFERLAPQWQRLAAEAGLDPLCNAHAWTLAYARSFAVDGDVFGWSFEQSGETVALVALRREPARGVMALRRALFLADGTFDSDYLAPPVRPGLERAVAAALIDAACRERGLDALVLAGLPDDAPFLAALRAETDARGLARREHALECLSAPLPDGFDGYLAGLKSRMRSKVRSAMRAVEERGARVEWCTRPEQLAPWLEDLFRLHEARWQARGLPGSFADARRREFYAAFCADALARDELYFARLIESDAAESDATEVGSVTALQLGVRKGERYYQIQEGYDPAREDARVGTALRGLALVELIARGVRAYDFMAGDSRHKRDWGGEPRPCTTLAFPLPRWRARLAYELRARVERWRAARTPAERSSAVEG